MTSPTRESKRGLPTSLARYADCGLKRTTLDIDTLMDNIEMTVVMTAQMVNFLDHQRRSSAMKGYLKVERDIQKVLHNYEEEFAKEPRLLLFVIRCSFVSLFERIPESHQVGPHPKMFLSVLQTDDDPDLSVTVEAKTHLQICSRE